MSGSPDVTDVTGNFLDPPPRSVKPRSREYRRLPVIAICVDQTLTEDGEAGTLDQLIADLPKMDPTLFVTVGSADLLARFNTLYSEWYPKSWQYRVTNHERDITRPDGVRVATRVSLCINYFGWKNGNYHKMIDPVTMYGKKLDDVWPERGKGPIGKLLAWGIKLRDFCDENNLEVRATAGAISAQLLTDKRFYPEARRKVPRIINERARETLPGNHYLLEAETKDREYTALYIDQSRAHHYHARTTALPHSDFLYAHGRFMDLSKVSFATVPENFYGLLCVDLQAPRLQSVFTWLSGDLTKCFVYTNELPHLLDMGYKVLGVRAAWGSHKPDGGIRRYATWASDQLDVHANAAWLKPLLLSAYGVLAIRPRYAESVFRLAKTGIPTTIPTGKYKLPGLFAQSSKKLEPGIANVIHRGMIEAATRSESVGLAQHLQLMGHQVLSIYADAVIVELDEDNPLPALPEPWRIKDRLTHLQFLNQQAFMSGEMTKLPGFVGRDLLKHTKRSHAPRTHINVAEAMEMEEAANQLMGDTQ